MKDVLVSLGNMWVPASCVNEVDGMYVCVVKYSEVAARLQLVSLTLNLPSDRVQNYPLEDVRVPDKDIHQLHTHYNKQNRQYHPVEQKKKKKVSQLPPHGLTGLDTDSICFSSNHSSPTYSVIIDKVDSLDCDADPVKKWVPVELKMTKSDSLVVPIGHNNTDSTYSSSRHSSLSSDSLFKDEVESVDSVELLESVEAPETVTVSLTLDLLNGLNLGKENPCLNRSHVQLNKTRNKKGIPNGTFTFTDLIDTLQECLQICFDTEMIEYLIRVQFLEYDKKFFIESRKCLGFHPAQKSSFEPIRRREYWFYHGLKVYTRDSSLPYDFPARFDTLTNMVTIKDNQWGRSATHGVQCYPFSLVATGEDYLVHVYQDVDDPIDFHLLVNWRHVPHHQVLQVQREMSYLSDFGVFPMLDDYKTLQSYE